MKISNITPFAFGDNLVRSMTDENGNPWFVAKDVCRVLCIENNRDAISTLDEDEKITVANPDGNPRAASHTSMSLSPNPPLRARLPQSQTGSQSLLQVGALRSPPRPSQDRELRDAGRGGDAFRFSRC